MYVLLCLIQVQSQRGRRARLRVHVFGIQETPEISSLAQPVIHVSAGLEVDCLLRRPKCDSAHQAAS